MGWRRASCWWLAARWWSWSSCCVDRQERGGSHRPHHRFLEPRLIRPLAGVPVVGGEGFPCRDAGLAFTGHPLSVHGARDTARCKSSLPASRRASSSAASCHVKELAPPTHPTDRACLEVLGSISPHQLPAVLGAWLALQHPRGAIHPGAQVRSVVALRPSRQDMNLSTTSPSSDGLTRQWARCA